MNISLADFFSPLTIPSFLFISLIFFQFEIIGFFIAKKLSFPNFTRPTWWILGLAQFVFLWFVLHFFLKFNQAYILLTLCMSTGLFLPFYWENKAWASLIKSYLKFPFLLIFLLLVVKRLSYWFSAPPYAWDEMAYHYYSPARILYEKTWTFYKFELYNMFPRFFETAFGLVFSATRTQAAARLLHFSVFLSIIQSVAIFVKKRLGLTSAVVFSFSIIFLNVLRLKEATTGYIDVGVASLVLMSAILLVNIIIEKQKYNLLPFFIFLSIALGAKYSVLGFSVSSICLFSVVAIYRMINQKVKIQKPKVSYGFFLFIFGFLMISFGGFWYIKNLAYTYNPTYPFIFPCKQGLNCNSGQSFFSGWTYEFSWENKEKILMGIFGNNPELLSLTVLSVFAAYLIAFYLKDRNTRILLSTIIVLTFVEILLASKTSGFLERYFAHWQFYIPLFLAAPWIGIKAFKNLDKENVTKILNIRLELLFLLLVIFYSQYKIIKPIFLDQLDKFNNNEKMLPPQVKAYAEGKIDIYDWIKLTFPEYYQVIFWCGENKDFSKLYMADPQLIWTSGNGLSRAFFLHCELDADLLNDDESRKEEKINNIINDKAYITSLSTCDEESEREFQFELHRKYFELNQELVCQSEEIIPNLYKIE